MVHRHVSRKDPAADSAIAPAYGHRLDLEPIPKYRMLERGALHCRRSTSSGPGADGQ